VDFPNYDCVNLDSTTDKNIKSIPVLIYPVINKFDLLEKSLEAIDHPIDEILIINNSQNDNNTVGLKEKFPNLNIRILNLPSNLGCAASWNLGIKLYPHVKYWMFGSNDTVTKPGTLREFAAQSKSDRAVFTKTQQYNIFSLGEDIIKETGLFDEFFYPVYWEDEDYTDRFYDEGFKIHIINADAFALEGGSQSYKNNKLFMTRNSITDNLNREYFYEKKNNHINRGWNLDRRRKNEWFN